MTLRKKRKKKKTTMIKTQSPELGYMTPKELQIICFGKSYPARTPKGKVAATLPRTPHKNTFPRPAWCLHTALWFLPRRGGKWEALVQGLALTPAGPQAGKRRRRGMGRKGEGEGEEDRGKGEGEGDYETSMYPFMLLWVPATESGLGTCSQGIYKHQWKERSTRQALYYTGSGSIWGRSWWTQHSGLQVIFRERLQAGKVSRNGHVPKADISCCTPGDRNHSVFPLSTVIHGEVGG